MDQFDLYARFYDLDLGDFDTDLLMIQQFAARCGSPVLELACGTGRVLLPLARQGYQVMGVDIAPAMLEVARCKVAAEGLADRITLVEGDMREFALDSRFNLAFVAVNSFMHLLTTEDQLAALDCIRRHLDPGGLLLVDLFNPDLGSLLDARGQVLMDKTMTDPETGHRLVRFHTRTVDLGQQTQHVTYIVDEMADDGHVQRTLFPFSMRYLFRYELEMLLRHTGFIVEAIYGSYDLDEFSGDSDRMIAVARNPD
jgi:SAM-dependent methyltransferase